MEKVKQIVATEEEKIIYEELDDTEKVKGYEMICQTFDGFNFILKKPEPLKEGIKFTVHKLGVKGTMRRTEIYEDR